MIPIIEAAFDKEEKDYSITFRFHTPQEIKDFINLLVEKKVI